MSTTPTTPQWADFLFRKWVSDPANNGEYQLHLGPDETAEFFRDLAKHAPPLSPPTDEATLREATPNLDPLIADMTNAFLRWPLPDSVCADPCATKQGSGRIGTNLLSYTEARKMFADIVAPHLAPGEPPFVCFSCGTDGTPLYCPNCAKGLAQREPGDSELAKELRDMLAELSDVCDGNYYELVKSAKALINRYDKSAMRGEGKP